jgi:hypothetical protein
MKMNPPGAQNVFTVSSSFKTVIRHSNFFIFQIALFENRVFNFLHVSIKGTLVGFR